jgi:hypothetical protein
MFSILTIYGLFLSFGNIVASEQCNSSNTNTSLLDVLKNNMQNSILNAYELKKYVNLFPNERNETIQTFLNLTFESYQVEYFIKEFPEEINNDFFKEVLKKSLLKKTLYLYNDDISNNVLIKSSDCSATKYYVKLFPNETKLSLVKYMVLENCDLIDYLDIYIEESLFDACISYEYRSSRNCYEIDKFFLKYPVAPLLRDDMFKAIDSIECAKLFLKWYPDKKNSVTVKNKIYNCLTHNSKTDDYYFYGLTYPDDFLEGGNFKDVFEEHMYESINTVYNLEKRFHAIAEWMEIFPNNTKKIVKTIAEYFPMQTYMDKLLSIRPDLRNLVSEYSFDKYINDLEDPNCDKNYELWNDEPYFTYFIEKRTNYTKHHILLTKYKTIIQINKFLKTFPQYVCDDVLIKSLISVCENDKYNKFNCYFENYPNTCLHK